MNDVDTVAEAIWRTDRPYWTNLKGYLWEQVNPTRRDDYRRMAQAAIDALSLTEEERSYYDHAEPYSTGYEHRYVSDWFKESFDD